MARRARHASRRAPVWLAAVAALAAPAGCGGQDEPAAPGQAVVADAGPQHAHGLGVDPGDGTLYVATHTGLWRAPKGETQATRVGELRHDLMGFTVHGPGRFLASGHPDTREDLPPLLGLQRSDDGGRTWKPVSLLGEADLHVLRAAGRRIYGVDSTSGRFLTSADGGTAFEERSPPAAVFDLAIDPADSDHVVVATERGLFASTDTGRRWRPLRRDMAGLLSWPEAGELYLVDGAGDVARSADAGREFERTGSIGARPEAFAAGGDGVLYAAVHGGEVLDSGDGGATWETRTAP